MPTNAIDSLYSLRRWIGDPIAWRLSRQELGQSLGLTDLEAMVDFTNSYQGRGVYARIPAVQERFEIVSLLERVQAQKPRTIVEIGTFKGGTLFLWCRCCSATLERIVSIDLPGGRYGGGYHQRRRRLYEAFLADNENARLATLQCNSHDPETLERLKNELGGAPIDFLYIDGDHTYEGVKEDFEMYSPLVRPGGLVAFHDIVTTVDSCGVDQLWQEIRDSRKHEEFVAEGSGKGVGVIWM